MKKKPHVVVNASSVVSVALAVNTAHVFVTPAANVRGLIIRGGNAMGNAYPTGALLAKQSAPTGINDGLALGAGSIEVNNVHRHDFIADVFVPAGYGVYYFTPTVEADARQKTIAYELL